MFDEASYLYEVKSLSQHTLNVFSQGPVLYYLILPAFYISPTIWASKIPLFILDLAFLLVIYQILKRYDRNMAAYAALFYALCPIAVFVANHVGRDVPAMVFTFLSMAFFVRFHAQGRVKDLILTGLFLLLSGLTRETDFLLCIMFLLYLSFWHYKVGKTNWRGLGHLLGVVCTVFLIKSAVMTWFWTQNPTRLSSLVFLIFKNGGFLNAGILYFLVIFFLFVNPVIAILGYPKMYAFLKGKIDFTRNKLNELSRFKLISVIGFLVWFLFVSFLGPNEARYAYYVVPFIIVFAAERFRSCSIKAQVCWVILALVAQIALVHEYEKDSEGFEGLGKYMDALPTDVIYTNEPHRASEHFVPAVVEFKTHKKLVYLPNDEIPKLAAREGPVFALSYNRSGVPTLDEALQNQGVAYDKVTFVVSDYGRSVYGIGLGISLPKPAETQFSSFFMQPLRTSPEERLYQFLIRSKREFCATPKVEWGWFKYRACSWGE